MFYISGKSSIVCTVVKFDAGCVDVHANVRNFHYSLLTYKKYKLSGDIQLI